MRIRYFRLVITEEQHNVEMPEMRSDANGYDSKKAQKTSHFRAFPGWTYIQGTYQRRPLDRKLHYVFDTGGSGIMARARFSGKKGSFEPSP